MPVPASQLETWSNAYNPQAAQNAHVAVRRALAQHRSPAWMQLVDDYLQGSYRNHTSIFQDADVDLVLQWDGRCYYDFSSLDINDQIRASAQLTPAGQYGFAEFRNDVIDALRLGFGWRNVDSSGGKAIHVAPALGQRLGTDVIPCIQYRKYFSWNGDLSQGNVTGMTFWTQQGEQRWNFPKLHVQNGEERNAASSGLYKPTIRIFKNARNVAVNRGVLQDGIAPSFCIECLLSNVPVQLLVTCPRWLVQTL